MIAQVNEEPTVPQTIYVIGRQIRRSRLRQIAKVQIMRSMGWGPQAANPRRSRRKAMLSLAARMYREEQGLNA
jgi:hypothetical protein